MGVVEDVRSALQDFVAPELRALAVRIEKLETEQSQLRNEFKEFRNEVKTEFRELDRKMDHQYENLVTEIRRAALIQDLTERVARLEAERRAS